jgi:subtilisin family serine protease
VPITMGTMSFALDPNRLAVRLLTVALAIAGLLPATAAASIGNKGSGPLSPSLQELAAPEIASGSLAAQARHLGLPSSGPGSLVRDGGRVLVTARFARGAVAAFADLREAGARVVSADRQTQTVTLAVAPSRLEALSAVPGLKAAWQQRTPIAHTPEGQCEGGAVISEGLAQLHVDDAREAFELRGKGITVGVLSDSFDTASGTATDAKGDVLSGDLPGPASTCSGQQLPVDVLDEGPSGESDEGRAMLQIVHDLVPHSQLAFATAFESEEGFAENIEKLAAAGSDVIVDDVAWFEEPFFQDGPIAVAIENATADGATYLSAAGNENLFDSEGNEIASWEAPAFRDTGSCPEAIEKLSGFNGTHCMDFDPGAGTDRTFGITVEPKEVLTLDLQWAEPWFGVETDLDAFLLGGTGKILAASFEENSGSEGTQRPVEILQWENPSNSSVTVSLAINRFSGEDPRLKFILLQSGGGVSAVEYPESSGGDVVGPTIFGHAGAASAISVAAVPFDDSDEIESYSSRGPVTHYFGPVEGTTPAPALGSPEELDKPDLAATDCGATTFFAFLSAGTWRFCGTSAAAPHAAAVAALVRQAKPSLPEQQVRDVLTETAAPVGTFPPEAAGAGLVDAFEAIASLPGPIEGGDGPSEQVPPIEKPEEPSGGGTGQVVTPPGDPLPTPTPSVPSTSIVKHPPKLVRTRARSVRVVFRFGSNQADAGFLCKVDNSAFRPCGARLSRRFEIGRHVVKVKARGATGLVDPTPAVFRFRVIAVASPNAR